jgi:hypothetical protein
MSASPESLENPPETDLSFSSTSQPESQAKPSESGHCSHLRATLAGEPARSQILTKYESVISWSVNRSQDVLHPAKRRKVRLCSISVRVAGWSRRHRYRHRRVIFVTSHSLGRLRAYNVHLVVAGPVDIL